MYDDDNVIIIKAILLSMHNYSSLGTFNFFHHMLLLSIILAIAEIEETDTTLSDQPIKHGM